jgi:hypothetical protein
METIDYQRQAEEFLARHGLTFTAELAKDQSAPPWSSDAKPIEYRERNLYQRDPSGPHYRIALRHGDKWQITISRGSSKLSFEFWSSIADRAARMGYAAQNMYGKGWEKFKRPDRDRKPTAYDVLSRISNDANTPAEFDDFCAEFGYDTDSRKVEDMHKRCVTFALKLRQFFTAEELSELQEIN